MKKIYLKCIMIASMTLSGAAFAEDYSLKSDDDFFGMRDQVRTMDDASKDAYRTERQSRMMSMDQSQRDSQFSSMGASGKRNMENNGQRSRSGKRDGSGGGRQKGKGQGGQSGDGNQYRYGQGNDSGSGNQYRYGQGNDSGSGNQNRYGQGGGGSGGGHRYGQGRR